jgi:hypothetical protein
MDHISAEYATVDVQMPAALFTDLDAYAVAHGYSSVDAAVSDAIETRTERG